jgi:hypothetical protein
MKINRLNEKHKIKTFLRSWYLNTGLFSRIVIKIKRTPIFNELKIGVPII